MNQLDFTFKECLNKKVFIKITEGDDDEHTLYFIVENIDDYNELKEIIYDYEKQDMLDDYFVYR
jgi:hypothetical protein